MRVGTHHRPVAKNKQRLARRLRREQTDAEAVMWGLLRHRRFSDFKFRRQVPFRNYVLDFVCFERQIVIEVDGSQHANSPTDAIRDADLAREGFRVVRYWNNDVLQDREAVTESLFALLSQNGG